MLLNSWKRYKYSGFVPAKLMPHRNIYDGEANQFLEINITLSLIQWWRLWWIARSKLEYFTFQLWRYRRRGRWINYHRPIPRHQRLLNANRIVNSIEAALNINNYDPLILDTEKAHWEIQTAIKGRKLWILQIKPIQARRRPRCDIIAADCEVRGNAQNCENEQECWELFINGDMVDVIVERTNQNIETYFAKSSMKDVNNKYTFFKRTNNRRNFSSNWFDLLSWII